MNEKKQIGPRLPVKTILHIEAIALAWNVSQNDIIERAVSEFLLNNKKDVDRGLSLLSQIKNVQKEIG